MSIIFTLIIFCLIVVIHELGHMVIAKVNNIYVKEFWVGFGPTLFSFHKGETKYCLKCIPLGGACTFEDDLQSAAEPDRMFENANIFTRIATLFAGPFANFILAFCVCIILLSFSSAYVSSNSIDKIEKDSAAEAAGFQHGDQIIKVNNVNISIGQDLAFLSLFNSTEPITITYIRNQKINTVVVTPKYDEDSGQYIIGISFLPISDNSPVSMIKNSYFYVRTIVKSTAIGLWGIITGKIGLNNIGGIVYIADTVDTVYKSSKTRGFSTTLASMLNITVVLSTSLGIMNLIPIPGMDGGRILFAVIEIIRGKRIEKEIEEKIIMASMGLILILTIIITVKDIIALK